MLLFKGCSESTSRGWEANFWEVPDLQWRRVFGAGLRRRRSASDQPGVAGRDVIALILGLLGSAGTWLQLKPYLQD